MKEYQGEKAIISLTSWKARINTVGKTIHSLLKQCPGFHIVLVLSEEEFPQKEKELPEDLMLFVNNNLIEILWVYKNYKSFKKVLFTMDKYREVPVISADDDCLYLCNYAEELHNAWYKNKNCIHTIYACKVSGYQHGPATLYPPFAFGEIAIKSLNTKILETNHDDVYYGMLAEYLKIKIINIHNKRPYIFHDTIKGLSDSNSYVLTAAQKIVKKVLYENK